MRKVLIFARALAIVMAIVSVATQAEATVVQYMSQHPLPRKLGGGFCYIDVTHVHDFGPSDARMYRQVDGQLYFVGDPTPFEYQGPRFAYYGAHPVAETHVHFGQPVYCYLRGPHYHWYQPTPQAQASFELRGGAYWFTGTYEPVYYEQRPRYVVVNEAYAPIVYTRPVVDVTIAPPAFHGEIVGGGPGWRGRAVVGAPVVSAGVYVAPPPPPVLQVGVGINLGGPPPVVVGGGPPPVVVDHRHDNGRHRGWAKHGKGGGGWRGAPPPPAGGGWRGAPPPAPPPPQRSGGWRGGPPPQQSAGWRGNPPPQRGGGGKHGGWHR
jgi:hypothetical protein